jgi:hypothetical protein
MKKTLSIPIDQTVDRLYRRQEPEDIVADLVKRQILKGSEVEEALEMIHSLKGRVDGYRLKK